MRFVTFASLVTLVTLASLVTLVSLCNLVHQMGVFLGHLLCSKCFLDHGPDEQGLSIILARAIGLAPRPWHPQGTRFVILSAAQDLCPARDLYGLPTS